MWAPFSQHSFQVEAYNREAEKKTEKLECNVVPNLICITLLKRHKYRKYVRSRPCKTTSAIYASIISIKSFMANESNKKT